MARSTKTLIFAAFVGAPIIMLPHPRAVMGDGLFFGQAVVAAIATLVGLAFWAFDRK